MFNISLEVLDVKNKKEKNKKEKNKKEKSKKGF